jgi:hypothetical protein
MTTFTSEDRINFEKPIEPTWEERWGKTWSEAIKKEWTNQTSIEYFWPLTEQIGLDLDFEGCAKQNLYTIDNVTTGALAFTGANWTTVSNVPAQLTVTPNNPIGELKIGPINIGLEKEPSWYQKILYKLLGFNWKNTK